MPVGRWARVVQRPLALNAPIWHNWLTAVAIAHNLLVIIWYVLRDGVEFHDLGPDNFTRPGSPTINRRRDQLVRELQALGYTVAVTPAA